MSEIRLYVSTTEKRCEALLNLLEPLAEESEVAVATQEINEDHDIWETSIYVTRLDEAEIQERFQAFLNGDFADLTIQREVLPDVDWVAKSLEGLKPVRAGRIIVHGSHDRDKVRKGDISIEIDAGQAFGTGHHGTTAGCLEVIDRVLRSRPVSNALDLGTGSGVLAIAAHKLARIPILATDIDPVATHIAHDNARKNGVAGGITTATAPGFHHRAFTDHGPFDLIIANILARPLMALAPQLKRNLRPGGTVILSGILAEQRWKVLAAYSNQNLSHIRTIWRNGWVTIELRG